MSPPFRAAEAKLLALGRLGDDVAFGGHRGDEHDTHREHRVLLDGVARLGEPTFLLLRERLLGDLVLILDGRGQCSVHGTIFGGQGVENFWIHGFVPLVVSQPERTRAQAERIDCFFHPSNVYVKKFELHELSPTDHSDTVGALGRTNIQRAGILGIILRTKMFR